MQHTFVSSLGNPANAGADNTARAPGLRDDAVTSPAAHMTAMTAENRELRAELEQIRADRNRLAEIQRRLMELLNVQSPDKLVHDVRNILNERELLKALVGDL